MFKKLLSESGLISIIIDIDCSVIYVEGHQGVATKGYNPRKLKHHATTSSLPYMMNLESMSKVC